MRFSRSMLLLFLQLFLSKSLLIYAAVNPKYEHVKSLYASSHRGSEGSNETLTGNKISAAGDLINSPLIPRELGQTSSLASSGDFTCGPGRPCGNGACCGSDGWCG